MVHVERCMVHGTCEDVPPLRACCHQQPIKHVAGEYVAVGSKGACTYTTNDTPHPPQKPKRVTSFWKLRFSA